MRTILAILSCLVLLSGCTSHPNFQNLIDVNVLVTTEDQEPICGGTIISKGLVSVRVLTAKHCIVSDLGIPREFAYIKVSDLEFYKVKILKHDSSKDLAVLETVEPLFNYLPVATIGNNRELGDSIWLTGFGAGIEDSFSAGILSKLNVVGWGGEMCDMVDSMGFYGNSGGGVFNSKNELLGVVLQFGPQQAPITGWLYVSSLPAIKNFLRGIL
jgi:S1-C subfamily serine protease